MKLNDNDLAKLADLAEGAARVASDFICSRRDDAVSVRTKAGGDSLASQVVTEVDEQAQRRILDVLGPSIEAYELGLLTEESDDDGGRLVKDYFWCIDPLDGTLPFTQGITGYGVSIALVRNDGIPVIGVIANPTSGTRYVAVSGQGIRKNGKVWTPAEFDAVAGSSLHFYCDCTFAEVENREAQSAEMHALAMSLGYSDSEVRIGGGAVLNACALLENPPAVYFKKPKAQLGGGCFWDFAATACLFEEAGAFVGDFYGQALQLNRRGHPFMNERGVVYSTNAEIGRSIASLLTT